MKPKLPKIKTKFTRRADCMSPAEFAFFFLGLTLYDWQAECVEACRHEGARVALVAANGSGKTAAVNTVMLLWWLYAYPRGRAVVTSGSWEQIKTQLWPSLMAYATLFNSLLGWTFNTEEIRTPEGGFIRPFSTIAPKRAEGHHEKPHLNSPMLIMVDEAKGIPEGIFDALNRCTPTCLIYTSSPGPASGTFYNAFHKNSADFHTVRVSAFMCPHISPERIALARRIYGPEPEKHPIYRSMILGEFTEGDDALIIPRRLIERALAHKPAERTGLAYTAVDWAAGGDETVLAERRGNMLRILYKDRERDTVTAAARIVRTCRERGVDPDLSFGDVCGLGIGIMQAAAAMHDWYFREFNGGDKPTDEHYCNVNIEAWYYFRQSLERGEVCFPDGLDSETIEQLSNRMLDWDSKGRLKCESKEDMAKRGVHSPDRADALIMAWYVGRFMDYTDEDEPRELPAERPVRYLPAPKWKPGSVML